MKKLGLNNRLKDKFMRVGESITDTLLDLSIYSLIAIGLLMLMAMATLVGVFHLLSPSPNEVIFNRETCADMVILVHNGDIKEYEIHCDPFPREAMNDKTIRCDVLVSINEVWCLYDENGGN